MVDTRLYLVGEFGDAPDVVKAVAERMCESAADSDEMDECVHVGKYDSEWVVGDNYERIPFSFVYRPADNTWVQRSFFDGSDEPITYEAVLEAASIFYG